MGMIHLTGHIEVPVDKRGAIARHLAPHIALTLKEPGCVEFQVLPDPAIPGRYLVQETFQDRAAFEAHQARVKASTSGAFTEGFARTYDITGN